MNFRKYGFNEVKKQSFDREKMFITKGGETYNIYDRIQAANIDTDPKEVIKKYSCSIETAAEIMKKRGGIEPYYADIAEIQEECQTLGDVYNFKQKAEAKFLELPSEIRNQFGNNVEEFLKNASQYIKNNKKASEPQQQKLEVSDNDKQ